MVGSARDRDAVRMEVGMARTRQTSQLQIANISKGSNSGKEGRGAIVNRESRTLQRLGEGQQPLLQRQVRVRWRHADLQVARSSDKLLDDVG